MIRIILVRHGHVDWLAPERFRGRAELPLSNLGRRQAQAVASYICGELETGGGLHKPARPLP